MKRKALILMMSLALIAGGTAVYADVGAPTNPLYTVVTSIYGTNYYEDYDNYNSPDGMLPAGVTFYVWHDFDGALWGSTDPKAGESDSFVYVMRGDVMDESDVISPEVGVKTETTVTAVTTDNLNVRTGPGTGFRIVKTMAKGSEVHYEYTFNTSYTWAYVTDGNVSGWSCADYLQTKAAVESPQEETKSADEEEQEPEKEEKSDEAESNTSKVTGIIMICIGAAILIALAAAYLIRKKPFGGR